MRDKIGPLVGNLLAAAGVALLIEFTGGLPSQLAHLYYIPVVASALLLPTRLSLLVALLAAAAVSPLPDLVHRPLGLDLYYSDAAPWKLTPSGWIVRPIAFIVISILAGKLVRERSAKTIALATSASRGKELDLLGRIDKMILAGASEQESLQEIARLSAPFTGAKLAGIVVPDYQRHQLQAFYAQGAQGRAPGLDQESLPLGEGVGGWALLHGTVATSRNVFRDARYDKMLEFARRAGYVSAAAAPIVLEGEVLAALVVGYEKERDFSPDEIATLQRIAHQTAIAVANARQRESLQRLAQEAAIALTDAIESRDPYTGDHCTRLAQYALTTAQSLSLHPREIGTIRLGAALHDVGKIVVPDHILKKPDRLTPDEFAIIKQHCYSGGQICKRVSFLQAVYPIVYHHHERFDGRGYPDGIAGDRIPLGARIVAVVDAYDAMTSDRPYRKAMPGPEAEAILRDGAGSQWDPHIVERFLSTVPAIELRPATAS